MADGKNSRVALMIHSARRRVMRGGSTARAQSSTRSFFDNHKGLFL